MYFLTITDLLRTVFYNALSKRLPPRAAKIKPVSLIELGKEKRQFFNRRPKFIVCKKDTVGNGFFYLREKRAKGICLHIHLSTAAITSEIRKTCFVWFMPTAIELYCFYRLSYNQFFITSSFPFPIKECSLCSDIVNAT